MQSPYTVKKGSDFTVTSRDVTNKTSRPGMVWLVTFRLGTGEWKIANHFYSVWVFLQGKSLAENYYQLIIYYYQLNLDNVEI